MKFRFILFIIFSIIVACKQNVPATSYSNTENNKLKEDILGIAEKYSREQYNTTSKKWVDNTFLVFSSSEIDCAVDPTKLLIADINEDNEKDAIVTIYIVNGNNGLPQKEHLILISRQGKLDISRIYKGEIKFVSVLNRVIYIETSKIAPDSPLYGCARCTEIHQYHFISNDTVRIQ